MPLFSDYSYYSGSPSYSASGSPYNSYGSSSSPLGSSFSASYLGSGSTYSNHSSLGGYSRTPFVPRWVPPSGRTYSPLLTTISERTGVSSPHRIASPRRTHISKPYISSGYTPRPININTADIDVSRDKYKSRIRTSAPVVLPQQETKTSTDNPFMPRVDGKPETGIDSSPGNQRSTIKRGRTVVRLHTIKRKERDSPRKPQNTDTSADPNSADPSIVLDSEEPGIGWRDRLSEDLQYKEKREKKTLGEKLVEKFIVKNKEDDVFNIPSRINNASSSVNSVPNEKSLDTKMSSVSSSRSPDRRCSMEMLAEQANVLDSLIRSENLSTATLDLSKIGNTESKSSALNQIGSIKRRKHTSQNNLQTTKSDHSLHDRVKSLSDNKDKHYNKKRSLKKSSSGGSICRLDSITEFPKEPMPLLLPAIEENRFSIKKETPKSKLKPKISSSVEVSEPTNTIKFRVENVTVEEKVREPKKEIIFSAVVETPTIITKTVNKQDRKSSNMEILKTKMDREDTDDEDNSDNFWDAIGKRETIYLNKRKQNIQDEIIKNRRAMFWYPEEEESEPNDELNQAPKVQILQDFSEPPKESITLPIKEESVKFENEIQASIPIPNVDVHQLTCVNEIEENLLNKKISEPETNSENEQQQGQTEIADAQAFSDDNKTKIQEVKDSSDTLNLEKVNIEKMEIKFEVPVNKEILKENIESPIYPNIPEQKVKKVKVDNKKKTSPSSSTESKSKKDKLKENPINKKVTKSKDDDNTKIFKPKEEILDNTLKTCECECNCKKEISEDVERKETKEPVIIEECSPVMIDDESKSTIETEQKESVNNVVTSSDKVDNTNIKDENKDIPHISIELEEHQDTKEVSSSGTGEDNKAEITSDQVLTPEPSRQNSKENESDNNLIKLPVSPKKRIVKDEPAARPLIATPRPLQRKNPQVIHTSSSSESSSEEDSSDDDDADESDASAGSTEFYECEANPDGRTSTGSNDSGFDSSAPTSPAGIVFIKKDCDVNCHRKCEKLTANLCGVNQRLLVEALGSKNSSKRGGDTAGAVASGSNASTAQATTAIDTLEQELEASTAYGLFRKTGRFTPPARSIPRFRKYTIEDFHFIKVLGKGSFGKVLLAELRETEYYYAVKCLKKDVVLEDDDVECTLIERKVLALGTNHPYLCHLFATFQTDSHLFFVMEYLNGGDLMFHIQQSGRFPEARARFYAAEIVSGLKFLHKRGIVYRDLKLDNILLDFDGHVRIADFGMCKLQIYLEKTADTFCGTPDYMAPEIIKGLKYNQTVDWWSFGVLLYEMLIGQSPFSGCDEDELFWSICNEMPSYPRFLSTEALTVLTRLLDKDARTRLGGTECMHGDVREQDFFHAIHWDRLERRELEAPFKPRVRHPMDTQYFDRAFTGERPRLTAVEPQVLRSMDQEPFRGFSYTNPNATDR